MAQVAGYNSTE